MRRCLDVDSIWDPVWRLARALAVPGVELVAREAALGIRAFGLILDHPQCLELVGLDPIQGLERALILDHPQCLELVGLDQQRP